MPPAISRQPPNFQRTPRSRHRQERPAHEPRKAALSEVAGHAQPRPRPQAPGSQNRKISAGDGTSREEARNADPPAHRVGRSCHLEATRHWFGRVRAFGLPPSPPGTLVLPPSLPKGVPAPARSPYTETQVTDSVAPFAKKVQDAPGHRILGDF